MEVLEIQDVKPKNRELAKQNSCVNCANSEICKFLPEYTSFIRSLDNIYVPEFARLETGCAYWTNPDKKKKTTIG